MICQIISNRYFPKTQSDRRTVQVSISSYAGRSWDWFEYCRNWKAKTVFDNLGLTLEQLKDIQERVALDAKAVDPLEQWHEIVEFVSLQEKERLKDNALLAQTFYSMEYMLRMFYESLTGEKLHSPGESYFWDRNRFYGEGIVENDLRYLEFLTNKYHLNPRPRLILVVEGTGEYEQFPRLAKELFGVDFPRSRILIENLEGVGNFTGKKGLDRFGALSKFIDFHHSLQTFVFIVLDREGGTSQVKEKLIHARSKYFPGRTITKSEYVHLWDKSIEFDSFSHEEIARAMTEVSGQIGRNYEFQSDEIAKCEAQFGKQKDPLSNLFAEKCGGYGMPKRQLLRLLFGFILNNPEGEFDENKKAKRPIVNIIKKVLELEARNHQPINFDLWRRNQESGYFGDPIK